MATISPFVCFIGLLFILMVVGSMGGLALQEPYKPYSRMFTFVPRWQQEECGVPEWTGPNGMPRYAPKDEFKHHIPINGAQSYEVVANNKSFADRAFEYVTYITEGFTSDPNNYLAGNVNTEEKDASLLVESAGRGGDLKMSDQVPGNPLTNFPPNKPSPVDFGPKSNYMLLSDELEPLESGISCVNSRSCFATDFDRLVEKTGNYRQFTNNYKRDYPDSCSSPYQELVLSFYKDKEIQVDVPQNCI
jgi:hypothetical protein